jgi:hypothetical protein
VLGFGCSASWPFVLGFGCSASPSKSKSFSTIQSSCFRFYKDFEQVYRAEIKVGEPSSFAYWCMGDGAQEWKDKSVEIRLCTNNFTLKDKKRFNA